MGDKPGHEFHGNQYTAGGGAVERLHQIAAQHGVLYDKASGKFHADHAERIAAARAKDRADTRARGPKAFDAAHAGIAMSDMPRASYPGRTVGLTPERVAELEHMAASTKAAPDLAHLANENAKPADITAIQHTPEPGNKFALTGDSGMKIEHGPNSLQVPDNPTIDKGALLEMRRKMQAADPNLQDRGRPESGKVYRLTGGPGEKSISQGHTWAASEVKPEIRPSVTVTRGAASRQAAGSRDTRTVETIHAPGAQAKAFTKGQRAYARRKEREGILRDSGLVKVKGARSGKTYWE